MAVELDMRKWCAIIKFEGYTTPSSERALVQKFRQIVETFEDEGVDIDVFILTEDEPDLQSLEESPPRKPHKLADDNPSHQSAGT